MDFGITQNQLWNYGDVTMEMSPARGMEWDTSPVWWRLALSPWYFWRSSTLHDVFFLNKPVGYIYIYCIYIYIYIIILHQLHMIFEDVQKSGIPRIPIFAREQLYASNHWMNIQHQVFSNWQGIFRGFHHKNGDLTGYKHGNIMGYTANNLWLWWYWGVQHLVANPNDDVFFFFK